MYAADDYLDLQIAAWGQIGRILPIGFVTWPQPDGGGALLAWSGERLPPSLFAPRDGYAWARCVGYRPDATSLFQTFAGEILADGTWHLAPAEIDGHGRVHVIPEDVQTVTVTAGAPVLRPNAPSGLEGALLSNDRPLLRWTYSRRHEQLEAVDFAVYESTGAAFDFVSPPLAVVTALRGQTYFDWVGAPLTAGKTKYYTVRARDAAGVLSLIPRIGKTPSPDPDNVALGDSVKVSKL